MPAQKTELSELDRLRAEHEAEQRAQQSPAPAPQPRPAPAAPKPGKKPGPPKLRGRPRTGARVAAVQALFQSEQNNEAAEAVVSQFQRHRLGTQPGDGGYEEGRAPEADAPLFAAIVMLVAKDSEAVDKLVAAHLDAAWPLAKLDPVLRALLRAACAELREPVATAPPAKVLINEYLDIAHGFFGGDEPRFANGVLDAMARSLRAAEFTGPPRRRGG
ncbi:transcription antitermination factor NusB [Dankookia sp. GCM10030260]|uniref:transcription antitermination factor NusB n=1 Tax=Dankookia sp. GCM10030260 TaxID=3273390 RepID=UPI003611326E